MTDRELFELIDVEDFLNELGMRKVRDTYSGEIEFSCPFPGHSTLDSHPSATMATAERPTPNGDTYPKTSFYCFTCGAKGSAISFLAEYEGCNPVQAKRYLMERFAQHYVEADVDLVEALTEMFADKEKPKRREVRTLDLSVLDRFELNWPEIYMAWEGTNRSGIPEPLAYMLDRGFEPETLQDFHVGYDEISGRITIPAFLGSGELVGFKARAWWEDAFPKYKVLGGEEYGFEPYEVSRILWGGQIAFKSSSDLLIVREGEANAMKLHEYGYDNATGISGKRLSGIQSGLIREHAERVAFWFDDFEDSFEAAKKFQTQMPCYIIESENDPADSPRNEVEYAIENMKPTLSFYVV